MIYSGKPTQKLSETCSKKLHITGYSWKNLRKQIIFSPQRTDAPCVRAALTAPGGEADPAPGLEPLGAAAPGAGGPGGPGGPGGGGQHHRVDTPGHGGPGPRHCCQ